MGVTTIASRLFVQVGGGPTFRSGPSFAKLGNLLCVVLYQWLDIHGMYKEALLC